MELDTVSVVDVIVSLIELGVIDRLDAEALASPRFLLPAGSESKADPGPTAGTLRACGV
jgi:hypothetical protein